MLILVCTFRMHKSLLGRRVLHKFVMYCTIFPFLEYCAHADFTRDERLSYLDIYSISISNCLITLNASANFFIYGFNSSKFRGLVAMKCGKSCVTIKWAIREKIVMCANARTSKTQNGVESQVEIVKFHTSEAGHYGTIQL